MKKMDPNRFVIGERVIYRNHVTEQAIGLLEVTDISDEFVSARTFFGSKQFKFNLDGTATWSSNLSIKKQK